MFIIKKNDKKTVRKAFATYEDARSYVRKLIRKKDPFYRINVWTNYRNPSITEYGYSIEKL